MYPNVYRSTVHNIANKLYYIYKMWYFKATRMKKPQSHRTKWKTTTMLNQKPTERSTHLTVPSTESIKAGQK